MQIFAYTHLTTSQPPHTCKPVYTPGIHVAFSSTLCIQNLSAKVSPTLIIRTLILLG